jgi:hypothetical protein
MVCPTRAIDFVLGLNATILPCRSYGRKTMTAPSKRSRGSFICKQSKTQGTCGAVNGSPAIRLDHQSIRLQPHHGPTGSLDFDGSFPFDNRTVAHGFSTMTP